MNSAGGALVFVTFGMAILRPVACIGPLSATEVISGDFASMQETDVFQEMVLKSFAAGSNILSCGLSEIQTSDFFEKLSPLTMRQRRTVGILSADKKEDDSSSSSSSDQETP